MDIAAAATTAGLLFMMSATMRPYRPNTSAKIRMRIWRDVSGASNTRLHCSTHHPDKEAGLLGRPTHASITDDANGEACCKSRWTHCETGAKLHESFGQWDELSD